MSSNVREFLTLLRKEGKEPDNCAEEAGDGPYNRAEDLDPKFDVAPTLLTDQLPHPVLFEMFVGWAPFEGASFFDVLQAILNSEPPLQALPERTPPEVRRIIHRALRKERNDRYPTACEMLSDLNDLRRRIDVTEAIQHSADRTSPGGMSTRDTIWNKVRQGM
jgi:hypothetical protein